MDLSVQGLVYIHTHTLTLLLFLFAARSPSQLQAKDHLAGNC